MYWTVVIDTIQVTALLEYLDISHACIVLIYITSKSIILPYYTFQLGMPF